MNVVFAGTPAFAAVAAEAIVEASHRVSLVLTQPDRPAGRGLKLQASEVKQWAQTRGIAVQQPQGLRLDGRYAEEARGAQHLLEQLRPDVMVVAAYGLILPQWVLDLPRLGCLNIHASLLPRWRGAAPIHRAIEAGDAETGITIMQMDAGLDTGDMLWREPLVIEKSDTTGSLHDKLAAQGGRAIVDVINALEKGQMSATPQPDEGVTYAHKITKAESVLDPWLSAVELARRVRAFNPFPGAVWLMGEAREPLKIWEAEALDWAHDQAPGTVLSATGAGIDVACAKGVLRCGLLQRAGGKRLTAQAFIQGHDLACVVMQRPLL
jgi:methionyl-tRNA formyltransferase